LRGHQLATILCLLTTAVAFSCKGTGKRQARELETDAEAEREPGEVDADAEVEEEAACVAESGDTVTIGELGGTVYGPGGAKVEVPAGVFDHEDEYTITKTCIVPEEFELFGPVYELDPGFGSILGAVVITIPFRENLSETDREELAVWLVERSDRGWDVPLRIREIDGNTATVATHIIPRYFAVGRAPCVEREGATATVGSGGGVVSGPNGVEIDIPAGALAADTEIQIRTHCFTSTTEEICKGHDLYRMDPDDIVFSKEASYRLRYDPSKIDVESIGVWLQETGTGPMEVRNDVVRNEAEKTVQLKIDRTYFRSCVTDTKQ